ncbi:hypothetical protein PFICI_04550 [Pestalotiopsis fici W106-1]|uniref:Uncharacterized protein n=1 Tax=Pestalotiopsis fici (strain W106-1 / CGMCC3.15140) TaxID=1229662 RepID=W3X9F9_PESFW|nr:uncharacterized protein PFICI_04550 [Pestalotiopsis fici W106-1]ETS82674.1 hypothetical protein PFICI_04550 [Pestalotiopsis fici W106-1]
MARQLISSGSSFEEQIGYSRAVVTGEWVYDYETGTISPDVVEQTEQTFRNIEKALSAAGASVRDIVRVRYILPVRDDFAPCWPVLRKWLGGGGGEDDGARPAATMMVAGLLDEAMKIEIEVTARKGSARRVREEGQGRDEELVVLV